MDYKGFVFFGLINVGGEPFVIEYNCRLGDPETEVVLPRLKNHLTDLFKRLMTGQLDSVRLETIPETAATIMLTAAGYPGEYRKGDEIRIENRQADSLYLHAGTKISADGTVQTNGGRVMAITSFGKTIPEAVEKSLRAAGDVHFEGKYFRRDIGKDLVE
jgi:phosphoribosylamine--glycine ligase